MESNVKTEPAEVRGDSGSDNESAEVKKDTGCDTEMAMVQKDTGCDAEMAEVNNDNGYNTGIAEKSAMAFIKTEPEESYVTMEYESIPGPSGITGKLLNFNDPELGDNSYDAMGDLMMPEEFNVYATQGQEQNEFSLDHMMYETREEEDTCRSILEEMLTLPDDYLKSLHLTPEEITSGGDDYVILFEFTGNSSFLLPLGDEAGDAILRVIRNRYFDSRFYSKGMYLLKWILRLASLGVNYTTATRLIIDELKIWIDSKEDRASVINNQLPVYLGMLKGTIMEECAMEDIQILKLNVPVALGILISLKGSLPDSTVNILGHFNPSFLG